MGSRGISAFLVESGTPGFTLGALEHKLGIRSDSTGELIFNGAEVPAENRLGAEGLGYKIALSALSEGRISIAAACVGLAQAALDAAAKYLTERRGFGGPLSDQQGLRFMLAEMAQKVAAARALTRVAAEAKDRGEDIAEVSSLAKWTASDAAMSVTTDAVQLFGGNGYSREFPVERYMRDAKGAQIYEGTNQIHRLIVADHLLKRTAALTCARSRCVPRSCARDRSSFVSASADSAGRQAPPAPCCKAPRRRNENRGEHLSSRRPNSRKLGNLGWAHTMRIDCDALDEIHERDFDGSESGATEISHDRLDNPARDFAIPFRMHVARER